MSGPALQAISTGLFVAAIATGYMAQRRWAMMWRAAVRRELVLARGMGQLNQALASGDCTFAEVVEIVGVTGVRLADELNNQARHQGDFWPRVPKLGEQWPDFQAAKITFVTEDET